MTSSNNSYIIVLERCNFVWILNKFLEDSGKVDSFRAM